MDKTLVVLLGPTGVGKTDLSIDLAKSFGTSIVSCDSRQIYREMKIGTAVPSEQQLAAVPHFFIRTLSVNAYYNSWQFEQQALEKIHELHEKQKVVVMAGGSMMYIDAVCKGIDDIPTIDPALRQSLMNRYEEEGLESIRLQLKQLDPVFYEQVDLNNAKRVLHAVEVCLMAGVPYSSLRTNVAKDRGFRIIKIGLMREKEELYDRINRRVDGKIDEAEAIRLIKRNSRRYAKKQLSWFRRDGEIRWFHPDEKNRILTYLQSCME